MAKAQLTIYIIIGLIIVIMIFAIYSKKLEKDDLLEFESDIDGFETQMKECAKTSFEEVSSDVGMHESIREEFQEKIAQGTKECLSEYLQLLYGKGLNYTDADLTTYADFQDWNVNITFEYPIILRHRSLSYRFPGTQFSFAKSNEIEFGEPTESHQFSQDRNFMIDYDEKIELKDIKGKPAKVTYLKMLDKRDVKGEDLESFKVYGIYPIGYFSEKPIKIKLDVSRLYDDIDTERLRIAWQNPFSETWYYFDDTKAKDGFIERDIYYTTLFGLVNSEDIPQSVPVLDDSDIHEGQEPIPTASTNYNANIGTVEFTPPPSTFTPIPGDMAKIFYTIRAEMGATYDFSIRPECVPNGAFCFTGATKQCGPAGIYCKDVIKAKSPEYQNTLFRHELTHNLQQNNGGCSWSDTPIIEWGAEYYSASTYYAFKMETGKLLAHQAAEEMLKRPGCTEDILKDTSFCVKGAAERFKQHCIKPGEMVWYGNSGLN